MSNQDQLEEKKRQVLVKAFKEIDKNNDDNIDQNELYTFLKDKGKDINDDTLNKLFKSLDFDHDGSISM